jgi:hypothetical protein
MSKKAPASGADSSSSPAMAHPLYLTADEKALFEKLPTDVKEGWPVEEEKGTAYETDDELRMRLLMLKEEQPKHQALLEKLADGSVKTMEQAGQFLESLPPNFLFTIFFTLGARGMSKMLAAFLENVKSDADLDGISQITYIRHALLESNQQ